MRSRAWSIAAVLASSLSACGSPGPMTLDGVTILRHGVMDSYPAALYEGPVTFGNGCVGADAGDGFAPIIWPPTARLDREGADLVLIVDGAVIRDGDTARVGGGEYKDVEFARSLAGAIPPACLSNVYWLAGSVEPGT